MALKAVTLLIVILAWKHVVGHVEASLTMSPLTFRINCRIFKFITGKTKQTSAVLEGPAARSSTDVEEDLGLKTLVDDRAKAAVGSGRREVGAECGH